MCNLRRTEMLSKCTEIRKAKCTDGTKPDERCKFKKKKKYRNTDQKWKARESVLTPITEKKEMATKTWRRLSYSTSSLPQCSLSATLPTSLKSINL